MPFSTVTAKPTATKEGGGGVINGELFVGGRNSSSNGTEIESYDISADTWDDTYQQSVFEFYRGYASDGQYLYLIGGNFSSAVIDTVTRFDPVADSRSVLASLPSARGRQAAVSDGSTIWALGGEAFGNSKADIFAYDISADSWSNTNDTLIEDRYGHDAVLRGGWIYLIGGYDTDNNTALAHVERYEPATGTSQALSAAPVAKRICAVAQDEKYIYAIGADANGSNITSHKYDPAADSWSSFDVPAADHAFGGFAGVKPYIVGAAGIGEDTASDTTERIVGSWSPFAPQGLGASATGQDISLSWTQGGSVLEDTYTVYRATSSGASKADYTQIASGLTTTSYTDAGLTEGETYYYRVTGRNNTGESDLSNEAAATTAAPAPTFDTLTVVDNNGDGNADELACTWTEGGADEDGYRVLLSTDGGATFTDDSGLLSGSTTSYTTAAKRDGEQYTVTIRAVYSDATADSATKQATTELPDVATGDITPVDASVEDELTVPNASVADDGNVRYQIREANIGASYGSDIVVAQGGGDATFTGLKDGEQYDIRARSETEHVTGAYVSVADVTLLPAPGSLTTSNVGATTLDLNWTDTADNEDRITVDRRQEYANGFDAYSEIASLAANTSSYTDPTVLPGTTYEYRVTNVTEHVESLSTVQVTTDSLRPSNQAPASGWYVEVDTPNGTTRVPTVVGDPERDPSADTLERVTIPVPKDEAWDATIFDDAPVRAWHDGERLPIDTLVDRRQRPGRTDLICEGGTALYETDSYEFTNTDVHTALNTVINDTPYAADIDAPDVTEEAVATVDTEADAAAFLDTARSDTPVVVRSDGTIETAQTSFVFEGEQHTSGGTVAPGQFGDNPDYSLQEAADAVDGTISKTIDLDHEIPGDELAIKIRSKYESLDGELQVRIDGETVGTDLFSTTVSDILEWRDAGGGTSFDDDATGESVSPSTLQPGTHTVEVECVTVSPGGKYNEHRLRVRPCGHRIFPGDDGGLRHAVGDNAHDRSQGPVSKRVHAI